MDEFPWRDVAAFSFGVLKLSPAEFWQSTPKEIAFAANAISPQNPKLKKSELEKLLAAYPDKDISK